MTTYTLRSIGNQETAIEFKTYDEAFAKRHLFVRYEIFATETGRRVVCSVLGNESFPSGTHVKLETKNEI